MTDYVEYNTAYGSLGNYIPSPLKATTGRPKGWVYDAGRVESSSSVLNIFSGAKLRRYLNVNNATSLKINGSSNSNRSYKITLGGVDLGTFKINVSALTIPLPTELSGDQILELENIDLDKVGLAGVYIPKTSPFVDAYAENAVSFPGVPIAFFDSSVTANSSWLWDFGDGTTSTDKNPAHTYTALGEYTVTLTTNLGTKKVLVLITDPTPQLSPNSNKVSGPAPLSVAFDISNSYNYDHGYSTSVSNITWEFKDGTPNSILPAQTHIFNTPGTYDVALTIVGFTGVTAQTTIQIQVRALTPPVSDFSATPKGGLAVDFKDLSTNDPTAWAWDFGEIEDKTRQNLTHIFQTPGIYNVRLTATNADGSNQIIKEIPVTVTETGSGGSASTNFSYTIPDPLSPLVVQFTDLTGGNPTAWFWNFDDGSTSTEQNPSHTYEKAGLYNVFLTATVDGKAITSSKLISIQPGATPPASDAATPSTIPVNTLATVTITGTGFKSGSKVRIIKPNFWGIAKVVSISSTQVVFTFYFEEMFLGLCGVAVIATNGKSTLFENAIMVE
jgi:PKD repeat protein